jgi:tetratricopeptide (TPR) repeat protein
MLERQHKLIILLMLVTNVIWGQCCLNVEIPDDKEYCYLQKIDNKLEKGKLVQAERLFIKNYDKHEDALYLLLNAKYSYYKGRTNIAMDSIQGILKLECPDQHKAKALIMLGDIHFLSSDTLLAIDEYQDALRMDSLNLIAYDRLLMFNKIMKSDPAKQFSLAVLAYKFTKDSKYLLWAADEMLKQGKLDKSIFYITKFENQEMVRGYKYYFVKSKILFNLYQTGASSSKETIEKSKTYIDLSIRMNGYLPVEYDEIIYHQQKVEALIFK